MNIQQLKTKIYEVIINTRRPILFKEYDPKTLEISCSDYTLKKGLEWSFDELKELVKEH